MTSPRNTVKISVPLVPPSVNAYVRHTRSGRHYVTGEAKAFKAAVQVLSRGASVPATGYAVQLAIYLGKGQRIDVDNAAKLPLDALVAAGVIGSDAWIERLTIEKFRDWENPRTEIEVTAL